MVPAPAGQHQLARRLAGLLVAELAVFGQPAVRDGLDLGLFRRQPTLPHADVARQPAGRSIVGVRGQGLIKQPLAGLGIAGDLRAERVLDQLGRRQVGRAISRTQASRPGRKGCSQDGQHGKSRHGVRAKGHGETLLPDPFQERIDTVSESVRLLRLRGYTCQEHPLRYSGAKLKTNTHLKPYRVKKGGQTLQRAF